MALGQYLYLVQGDTFTFSTVANVNGVEPNLAGGDVSLYAIANPFFAGEEVLLNVSTVTNQITVSGANNSTVTVSLNSAFTNNIPCANVGAWFLRVENVGGTVYTLDRGRIAVMPGLPPLPIS